MHTHVCVCRVDVYVRIHRPMYTARVPETMKDKFYALKIEVWNESHIVWKLFQTPIFLI